MSSTVQWPLQLPTGANVALTIVCILLGLAYKIGWFLKTTHGVLLGEEFGTHLVAANDGKILRGCVGLCNKAIVHDSYAKHNHSYDLVLGAYAW